MSWAVVSFGVLAFTGLIDPLQAQDKAEKSDQQKLPGSTKGLGVFLVNTTWDLGGGKIFRFRGDGSMVMPYHDCKWKPTGPRKVEMFSPDWKHVIEFPEDMTTLEVSDKEWKGKMVRRLAPAVDDKKLEAILVKLDWARVTKEGAEPFKIANHGKILDTGKVWKSWELHDGLLLIKGKKGEKEVKDEFYLKEDKEPYTLEFPDPGSDRSKLQQR
ncbi:hypothetical protein [Luteolibacter sp. Populi]|uniref:hypothetical protein n=1 Tax=Luteolibacter sp. Populi TaxID=3230487 RepID=UPI0034673D2F